MKLLLSRSHNFAVSLFLSCVSLLAAQGALANGPVGEHVNHLADHVDAYTEEVNWIIGKMDVMVSTYESKGPDAAETDKVVDYWESVNFHAAIETNYIPVYAAIWQGLYGVKGAIDAKKPLAEVRKQQQMLEQSLWQGLGAVKLAAQYQQKGLLGTVKTTDSAPTNPPETLDEIKHRLDRVVAKYAEKLPDVATTLVHDTYLNLFEGVEGALIEQDADLVEDLEKDFNVTLPKAIDSDQSVDAVRKVVQAMQGKLDRAKALLVKAGQERKDVF
ncbi:hypothetical protein [uncultured Gilvimarinus sp.]|jgi:hypothetical protein|uniref:hypothetical protein n=1 Tax=uncultured Gilvimarinus sp. TaxID=1689143 RepID=UPI0030D9C850